MKDIKNDWKIVILAKVSKKMLSVIAFLRIIFFNREWRREQMGFWPCATPIPTSSLEKKTISLTSTLWNKSCFSSPTNWRASLVLKASPLSKPSAWMTFLPSGTKILNQKYDFSMNQSTTLIRNLHQREEEKPWSRIIFKTEKIPWMSPKHTTSNTLRRR